jgi:alkylation response protein AidB-like acyl-CoA dehydrogenase
MSSIATSSLASPSLDLDFNEDQIAIGHAVSSFCTDRIDPHNLKKLQPVFDRNAWQALAQLGVFSPATSLGEGGALEICAISEALGKYVFPGPVAATYLAAQVLQGDELASVAEGKVLISLSNISDTLLPWGIEAQIFLQMDASAIHRAETSSTLKAEQTLGGEPWARGTLTVKNKNLAGAERGLLLNSISSSAYLVAAGMQLVKDSSDYANVRKQFGKTLGEFQGVAHPLADCQISLTAAQQLARASACCFDATELAEAKHYAAGAAISSRHAALKAAYVCHQVYAGIGITLEGPAFHITRRIRQLASQAPGDNFSKKILLHHIGLGTH